MKFWLLGHVSGKTTDYDCNIGFVVAAENEADARGVAAKEAADEGADLWLSSELSFCKELSIDRYHTPAVVLSDFNAG